MTPVVPNSWMHAADALFRFGACPDDTARTELVKTVEIYHNHAPFPRPAMHGQVIEMARRVVRKPSPQDPVEVLHRQLHANYLAHGLCAHYKDLTAASALPLCEIVYHA